MNRPTPPQYALDVMQTQLITARPEMTCEELQELLVMNHISGAPVVDADNRLKGVISMSDILSSGLNLPYSAGFMEDTYLDRLLQTEGFHVETLTTGFVEDFMTRKVITAYPNTRIEELAELMYNNHIHRVVIVEPQENTVLGLVTTFDLLHALMCYARQGVEQGQKQGIAKPACGKTPTGASH